MNDHDLLIKMDVKLDTLKTSFCNHLQDHKKYMIMAWTISIGAIVSLILIIIKSFKC